MINYNNYWKLIFNEMPSKGIFYNSKASIRIRPLNVQEVKYLSTITAANATDIINEILKKCIILDNLEFEDILLADREYMVFWLRVNSFQQNNGYDLKLNCEDCSSDYNHTLHLAEFPTVSITSEKEKIKSVYLPDCGMTLNLKYPTIKDLNRTDEDNEIQNFMRHLDVNVEEKDITTMSIFLTHLSALDYSAVKTAIESKFIGFDRNVNIPCSNCGKMHTYFIDIADNGLFGSINTAEVLEIILRISKYTNYQVPDEQPWWEVEIMQNCVNNMIEEEKQAMDKESGKMTMNKPGLPM